jgi:hypothetical protein
MIRRKRASDPASPKQGWLCALVMLLALAAPLAARPPGIQVVATQPPAVSAPLWSDFHEIVKTLRVQLGTPRRLGQLGILAICLALYILMRK